MRLQRLEIKGFKSFANETVIHFNEDVIGVVGPNGAGKSNLVDAVRWVLGEQKSRDLRLDKMSDVIFNGTKKKKAGGVAYVALTFENTRNLLPTEYQTVTIARYLYRSGESEYRLNNVVCRLKDIRSLFLDTGIGSNSYAIIALGMVEDILSDKENARRRMFEQAAGISKYKARKKETLNKLNATQADLDRVEDLLYEIEQNLKTLEKQARRTQRYFDLKAKYKDLSLQLAVIKTRELKEQFQSLKMKIEGEQDLYRQLDVKIHELEAALEALKNKHLDKEKSLSDFQRSMNELIGNIRTAENDRKILQQKFEFLQQNDQKLESRVAQNTQRISQLQQGLEKHTVELEEVSTLEKELAETLASAREELQRIQSGHGETREVLNRVVKDHQQKQNDLVALEKELVANETSTHTTRSEINKLEDQAKRRTEEYGQVESALSELTEKLKRQADIVRVLEEKEFDRQQRRQQLEEEEDKVSKTLQDLQRQRDARQHEYDLIKSLVDKLEGFPDSIKFLTKSGRWDRKAPLLSDLIYSNEPYRVLIENFLEPYLNYYVVDAVEDAAAAIQLLSEAQKGRANFFVLEAFKPLDGADMALPDVTPAIDVVEIDDKYRPVVEHLLHKVYIATGGKSLMTAKDVADDVVLLSADGQFIRKRHSLSGGSVGLFEGKKLGRKKHLKKLESTLEKLVGKIGKKEEALDSINDHLADLDEQDQSQELDLEKNRWEELKREEVYFNSRLEHYQDLHTGSNEGIQHLQEKLKELAIQNEDLQQRIAKVSRDLENERSAMESADDSYNEIATRLADQNALVNQKNIELIRFQSKRKSIEQEQQYGQHQIKELNDQIREDTQQMDKNRSEQLSIQEQIDLLGKNLEEYYTIRKSREEDLSGLEQSYYEARGEITNIENEIRQAHRRQNDQQQLINDLKDTLTDVKFKLSNVGERLKIEFEIALDEVLRRDDVDVDGIDLAELDEKVERLRNRINNYGEINPMAVDAYNEMEQRYESITSQRDDILEARDSLMETMKEIEDTATKRFMEAFRQVRENFIEVFRSLFTEDDACDLILLEPEDPLASPIEIIAKPKGKRPKTLSQLSGGEKTLTAIALLFGLYLLKPAPFCIFDEVDAPLDDANIEKFNRIIKRFSNESQFIIITHNKLTMAAVDVIYGVYMEEQGVSNLTPVDFRSLKHGSLVQSA